MRCVLIIPSLWRGHRLAKEGHLWRVVMEDNISDLMRAGSGSISEGRVEIDRDCARGGLTEKLFRLRYEGHLSRQGRG